MSTVVPSFRRAPLRRLPLVLLAALVASAAACEVDPTDLGDQSESAELVSEPSPAADESTPGDDPTPAQDDGELAPPDHAGLQPSDAWPVSFVDPDDDDTNDDDDTTNEPPADGSEACPCFDGPGTYCADAALERATELGCTLPKAEKHDGDLLSCRRGTWRWDTTCAQGQCLRRAGAKDRCEQPVYQLPWTCGHRRLCTAINAESWHHEAGSASEFAYDFRFESGSKVRAARGGRVAKMSFATKPGSPCYNGCDGDHCESACGDKANVLTVRHSDGTVAQYLHLNAPGDGIEQGTWVEQGQVIARSGNTGWSTGPHLHFMVMEQGCALTSCSSIPMKFFREGALEKYHSYRSRNCR